MFFSVCFWDFLFITGFQIFDHNVPWYSFHYFYSTWGHSRVLTCGFMLFSKFGNGGGLAVPSVSGSSQGKDQIQARAATYTTAANAQSLTHCARSGLKSVPQQSSELLQRQRQLLNLLRYSENSKSWTILALTFQIFSCPAPLSPYVVPITWQLDCLKLFQRSLTLCSFFPPIFFSLCLIFHNLYCWIFNFMAPLFPPVSNLHLIPSNIFFTSHIIFSSVEVLFGAFPLWHSGLRIWLQ